MLNQSTIPESHDDRSVRDGIPSNMHDITKLMLHVEKTVKRDDPVNPGCVNLLDHVRPMDWFKPRDSHV